MNRRVNALRVVNVGECIANYLEIPKILLSEVKESEGKEGKEKEKEKEKEEGGE